MDEQFLADELFTESAVTSTVEDLLTTMTPEEQSEILQQTGLQGSDILTEEIKYKITTALGNNVKIHVNTGSQRSDMLLNDTSSIEVNGDKKLSKIPSLEDGISERFSNAENEEFITITSTPINNISEIRVSMPSNKGGTPLNNEDKNSQSTNIAGDNSENIKEPATNKESLPTPELFHQTNPNVNKNNKLNTVGGNIHPQANHMNSIIQEQKPMNNQFHRPLPVQQVGKPQLKRGV